MSVSGALHDRTELVRRLVFTMAALLVYRLGTHIPLPGLDPRALTQLADAGGPAVERVSILALGIYPLVGVLVLAEMIKVIAPRFRRWERAQLRNRDTLNRILVALAMVAAIVQGAGFAGALENVRSLVEEPGLQFRLTCIATLVPGTAIVIWLADQITRHGLGSGVWLLFAVPTLADLPYRVGALAEMHSQGVIAGTGLLLCFAFVVIAFAALTGLVAAGRDAPEIAAACLWPVLLSYTVLPWLLVAMGLTATGGDAASAASWVEPGRAIRLLALAGLVGLFVHLYVRSNRLAGAAASSQAVPPLLIGIVLGAIAVAGEILPTRLSLPVPVDAEALIVIALVAMVILATWWSPPHKAAT